MPNGTCRKKETFEYFHWTGEQDNEALIKWLIDVAGYIGEEIYAKGNSVYYRNDDSYPKSSVFNMKFTPYFVLNEDFEVLDYMDRVFHSMYIMTD